MKKGLVMEGGAMRCMFTAGVIDTLMKEKIKFDGAIGVSAGAAFGCNYKSEQIGRVLRYNIKYAHDPRLSSWQSWLKTGDLYGADFCYRELPVKLDIFDTNAFQKNPMDFWCVATDIDNGEAVYHRLLSGKEADLKWIRASSSIPVFARPVEIGTRKYWDGGISDSIPIKFFEKIGYQKNVVILTQPLSYRKEASKLYPALELVLHKYPAVLKKLKTRATDYNDVLSYIRKKEVQGKILVIRPPYPLDIGTMKKDPKELKRVYNIGVKEAQNCLKAVQSYLKE